MKYRDIIFVISAAATAFLSDLTVSKDIARFEKYYPDMAKIELSQPPIDNNTCVLF
jgi:hypothetical protein